MCVYVYACTQQSFDRTPWFHWLLALQFLSTDGETLLLALLANTPLSYMRAAPYLCLLYALLKVAKKRAYTSFVHFFAHLFSACATGTHFRAAHRQHQIFVCCTPYKQKVQAPFSPTFCLPFPACATQTHLCLAYGQHQILCDHVHGHHRWPEAQHSTECMPLVRNSVDNNILAVRKETG